MVKSTSAYDVSSFAANANVEIERLNAQVDLFWPSEGDLLEKIGLSNTMRLLDCGCGPGRLLEHIKTRFPNSHCEGVEIDSMLVNVANQKLSDLMLDVNVREGSAESFCDENASFDFIIMRLVLEHLPDPHKAITNLAKHLRPHGKLIVISNDFEYHLRTYPEVPELTPLYAAYCKARRNDGGNPCIGREVPQHLINAGLSLATVTVELAHNGLIGDQPFLKSEGSGIPAQLVASGYLDNAVLEPLTRNWLKMLQTPGHSISRQLWIAVGEKPSDWREISASKTSTEDTYEQSLSEHFDENESATGKVFKFIKHHLKLEDLKETDSLSAFGVDSMTAISLQDSIKLLTGTEVPLQQLLGDTPIQIILNTIERDSLQKTEQSAKSTPKSPDTTEWDEGEL